MTTHDPLVIGGLTKKEIRIFQSIKSKDENGKEYQKIETFEPDFDPKGLGVAGILTSEFFNLPAAMDEDKYKYRIQSLESDIDRLKSTINKLDSRLYTLERKVK